MKINNLFANRSDSASNFEILKQPINSSDDNKNNEIDRDRFESVMLKRGVPSQLIETLFNTMDVNGDGKISKNDFQRALQMDAQRIPKSDLPDSNNAKFKVHNTALANTSYFQNNRHPNNPQITSKTIEELITTLEKQAGTYNKSGVPHISVIGAIVNALV